MAERDPTGDVLAAAAAALRAAPIDTDDRLAPAIAALRDAPAALSPAVAETRNRVMASLERRGHGRRKRVVVAAVMATLGTGTLSWAAATGRVERALVALTEPAIVLDPGTPDEPVVAVAVAQHRKSHRAHPDVRDPAVQDPAVHDPAVQDPAVQDPAVQSPASDRTVAGAYLATEAPTRFPIPDAPAYPVEDLVPPPPGPARPRPRPPVVEDPVDQALYRRAHAAHFHGTDPAEALVAWDRYLAERPAGRFAIEAHYNRALVLIRLDRGDDARAALAPFADGEVAGGYRQHDARALIDALDHARDHAGAP